MGDKPAFMIKGGMPTFVMGDGIRDVPAFVIKGDTPLETLQENWLVEAHFNIVEAL
jgi:hypothetical protein